METIETLNSRINELQRENKKIKEKFENCRVKLKQELRKAKKHQKDNTCIFRIKSNKQKHYFNKSPVNQRRCRKQVRDLLKNVDGHIHGIGNYKF